MRHPIVLAGRNRFLLAIPLIVATTIASDRALSADAQTHWACWYSRDMAVTCELKAAAETAPPRQGEAAAFGASGGTAPAAVRAGRLPGVVQTLRDNPGALAGKQVRIPLHTDPTDMAFVQQLAQAVMCGSRAACRVEFKPSVSELATLAPADLVDRTDAAIED